MPASADRLVLPTHRPTSTRCIIDVSDRDGRMEATRRRHLRMRARWMNQGGRALARRAPGGQGPTLAGALASAARTERHHCIAQAEETTFGGDPTQAITTEATCETPRLRFVGDETCTWSWVRSGFGSDVAPLPEHWRIGHRHKRHAAGDAQPGTDAGRRAHRGVWSPPQIPASPTRPAARSPRSAHRSPCRPIRSRQCRSTSRVSAGPPVNLSATGRYARKATGWGSPC